MDNKITGTTRLAALFATPIRHSVSPMMHNAAFQALNIDAVYLAFEVGTEGLKPAIDAIRNLEMMGANLSMPNKTLAMKYMDEVTEAAHLIGAVNTIVNDNGRLIGYNTDGTGFMKSLDELHTNVTGKKMTIIGAGGAATAIIVQAALDGIKEIAVYNRKDNFSKNIKEKTKDIAEMTGCRITLHDLANDKELSKDILESELLVNATGVGMKPLEGQSPIHDFSVIRSDLVVCDVIYTPRETEFLKQARLRGAKTSNGLGMLLYQGAAAFEKWTGKEMPIEVVKAIIEKY